MRPAAPHLSEGQDEALKTLITRFKAAPADHFVELAQALLSRGNGNDALRVLDDGLQDHPTMIEGRLTRAETLITLKKPQIAYVELMRILALAEDHPKALRLLGQVHKLTGQPERAAELLSKRSVESEAPTQVHAAKDPNATQSGVDADTRPLLEALAQDLSLGPRRKRARAEVTQVIRTRRAPREEAEPQTLQAIEGPIVDTSQAAFRDPHAEAPDDDASERTPTALLPNVPDDDFDVGTVAMPPPESGAAAGRTRFPTKALLAFGVLLFVAAFVYLRA